MVEGTWLTGHLLQTVDWAGGQQGEDGVWLRAGGADVPGKHGHITAL